MSRSGVCSTCPSIAKFVHSPSTHNLSRVHTIPVVIIQYPNRVSFSNRALILLKMAHLGPALPTQSYLPRIDRISKHSITAHLQDAVPWSREILTRMRCRRDNSCLSTLAIPPRPSTRYPRLAANLLHVKLVSPFPGPPRARPRT